MSSATSKWAWYKVALAACLVLAVVVLSHGLGTSSLFVDETASWHAASGSLGDVFTRVRLDEVAPSTYYLLLHAWIGLGSDASEAWMRLPSMLAGVALVGAIAWLAYLVSGRLAACLAALLAALDPAILNYAQEVRAYIFAMLAVTVAVAAFLASERTESSRSWWRAPRTWWFAISLVAAVVGYSLHYTAGLVLFPLTLYVLGSRAFSRRLRIAWAVVVAVTALAWLPLLVEQLRAGHNGWLGTAEHHWGADLGQTFGAALAGRAPETPTRALIGAAIVCAGIGVAVGRSSGAPIRLVAAAAIIPPVALLAVTLFGQPAMLGRYAAAGVPFMIVALAAGAVSLGAGPLRGLGSSPGGEHPGGASRALDWRRWGVAGALLVVAWLGLAALGVRASYETIGHYADMRAVVQEIRTRIRPHDVVVGVGNDAILFSIDYYATRLLARGTPVVLVADPRTREAVRARRTLWTVTPPLSNPQLDAALGMQRYRAVAHWTFPAMQPLELVEAVPRRPS